MKGKIQLTKEQVDKHVATEEKYLRMKLEKDLASLRKKYEFVEVDIKSMPQQKPNTKNKISPEILKNFISEGKTIKEISSMTGYNEGYLYRLKKQE